MQCFEGKNHFDSIFRAPNLVWYSDKHRVMYLRRMNKLTCMTSSQHALYQGTPVTSLKTDTEVLTKQLKNLNTSKSMGPDGCHPRLSGISRTPDSASLDKKTWAWTHISANR